MRNITYKNGWNWSIGDPSRTFAHVRAFENSFCPCFDLVSHTRVESGLLWLSGNHGTGPLCRRRKEMGGYKRRREVMDGLMGGGSGWVVRTLNVGMQDVRSMMRSFWE